MNTPYTCPMAGDGEIVHRYVAGTLETDDVDAFEIHLLGCDACARAVHEGSAVAAALRLEPGRARRSVVRWGLPLAAAAAAAIWLLLPREDALERLGRVDRVPGFDGLPVRAPLDSATALVDRGMEAYRAGDFARSAELLGAAAALESSSGVQFFLGIALLKAGAPARAAAALGAALDPPDNPYAAEARLYRAKAWLALGSADSALAQLAAVPATAGAARAHATALADSIRSAMVR